MRFEVDLPDGPEFADWRGRHKWLFVGMELGAYQLVGEPVMVKTSRCSICGRCCTRIGCEKVKQDGSCSLNLERPFCCGLVARPKNLKECTENFAAVLSVR